MITIDRSSAIPVQTQVADQLRYHIATGRNPVGTKLPSTRALADQLDISYHTVRAAYRILEEEGLIEGRGGSGFRVKERPAASRAERMEQGASVFQDALQRLVGIGLGIEEIEYLFQEQAEEALAHHEERKLVFASPALEMAELCAEQLSAALQRPVEASALSRLEHHSDADFILAPYQHVRTAMAAAPRADVRGLVVHLNGEALEEIVRLYDEDTLGVVTRRDEAVRPLVSAIRAESGFSGQMLAFSAQAEARELSQLIDQSTLTVHTPQSRRLLLPYFRNDVRHVAVRPTVSEESLASLRRSFPYR